MFLSLDLMILVRRMLTERAEECRSESGAVCKASLPPRCPGGVRYSPFLMKSAIRSPITMVVTFVLALMQSGMMGRVRYPEGLQSVDLSELVDHRRWIRSRPHLACPRYVMAGPGVPQEPLVQQFVGLRYVFRGVEGGSDDLRQSSATRELQAEPDGLSHPRPVELGRQVVVVDVGLDSGVGAEQGKAAGAFGQVIGRPSCRSRMAARTSRQRRSCFGLSCVPGQSGESACRFADRSLRPYISRRAG